MAISKAWRLGGFVAALGASGALIASATGATGAYFTDSHSGTVYASTGSVKVNTTDLALKFTGLLPGDFQTQDVTYTAAGSGAEDIWLVLPTDGTAAEFNGVAGEPSGDAALGRYGHFAVDSPAGSFTSFNLTTAGTAPGHTGPSCTVDADGHGGSATQATDRSDTTVPFCPVPGAILLSSNLTNGQTGTAHITFGFTKLMNNPAQENLPLAAVAQFKIVATQHGILPTDPNN
jgi:hypothetical protein